MALSVVLCLGCHLASAVTAPSSLLRHPRKPAARNAGSTIPIYCAISPGSVTGGGSVQVTIRVDQVPTGGGAVLVDTDHRSTLISPSGSWPYTLNYPDGSSTTKSFTITTSSVGANVSLHVGSCETDYDSSNPANWQVSAPLTVLANP